MVVCSTLSLRARTWVVLDSAFSQSLHPILRKPCWLCQNLVTAYHPTLTYCPTLDEAPTSSALIPPVTVTGLLASTLFSQVSSQHSSQSDPLKLKSDHVNLLLQARQRFLVSLKVEVRGQQSPQRSAPWLPSPPLSILSHASLFRILSPSIAPPGTWWAGWGGGLCPGHSLCLAQSSPNISKSYSLPPASFSQMLISHKTYSDHPLIILTLNFHSFISSATF